MLTAGIIIIGDEILNGRVTDSISPFLCQRFHALGVRTRRISVVADDIDIIASDIKSFSDSFDIVITTGGVGPTHDDVTYEAVARAFGTALRVDDQMKKLFAWYMDDEDPSAERLIKIPSVAESLVIDLEVPLEGPGNKYPVVRTKNVYNFPGIPSYTKALFAAMERKYFQDSVNFFLSREIYLLVDEIQILPILNKIVAEYQNRVSFGSYPIVDGHRDEGYLTKICLESSSITDCLNAETVLLQKLPPQWYGPAQSRKPRLDLIEKLMLSDCELAASLKSSYQIIDKCFVEYDPSEMFLCFNGGKDCTVLLTLVYYYWNLKKIRRPLQLLYFHDSDSFPEVDAFIGEIKTNYQVDFRTLPIPMKPSLIEFLEKEKKKKICFLGQRNSDPRSRNLKPVQETDSGWPKLIRIFPILHWSYKDVWDFIRCVNIPYCSLYDRGFTSLGTKKNTDPNPALKTINGGKVYYRPAFLLSNENCEREGRLELSGTSPDTNS